MEIVIDFDGTCVTHDYPKIGRYIGAVPILKKLIEKGHKLILFTMRSGNELNESVQWFIDNDINLYGIQKNPNQINWTTSPKAYGQLYIDDAALGCPLIKNKHKRPYVDWIEVENILKLSNII